jgi:nicotinate-nucleotide adenylyltransferase
MKRLGIYGGSFNPIHAGHVGVALKAAADHALDQVLVVPAKVSPFKTMRTSNDFNFTDVQRWEMVVAACAPHPQLVPCDIELKRGGVSYTIDTVRTLKNLHPEAELFFIVGEDSIPGLPMWKNWDELSRLATFVSYPRTPESSSEIRRRIAAGEAFADMVPQPVADLFRSWLQTAKSGG